jgi:hypothetical protein
MIARKSETHQQIAIWIDKELLARVKGAAVNQGWIALEGRSAGGVHVNMAIEELLKIGLDSLRENIKTVPSNDK